MFFYTHDSSNSLLYRLWFKCKVSHAGSHVWTVGLWLVVLTENLLKPSGHGAQLVEAAVWLYRDSGQNFLFLYSHHHATNQPCSYCFRHEVFPTLSSPYDSLCPQNMMQNKPSFSQPLHQVCCHSNKEKNKYRKWVLKRPLMYKNRESFIGY